MRSILLAALLSVPFVISAKGGGSVFIENVGQLTDQHHRARIDIDFALQCGNMNAFIEAGAIHYQFLNRDSRDWSDLPGLPSIASPFGIAGVRTANPLLNIHRIDVELLGANKNVQPIKEGRLQYYERYYTPQFGEDGGMAHAYSRIVYKDIYPHIDWVIYINGEQVEYDFVVREGGHVTDIQLKYGGVSSLRLDAKGNLSAATALGTITEHSPVAWQEDGREVKTAFKVSGDVVSFSVAACKGTLLIDPYIEWATYYGGAGIEIEAENTMDATGNVYLSATTFSAANIATTGAYDVSYADSGDVFIVKFNSVGIRLWGTYFGGTAPDRGGSITYDNHGYIYLSGSTSNSIGIATIGSNQPSFSGPYVSDVFAWQSGDAFLVKFDTNGNRIWGTYFGGEDKESSGRAMCDTAGNVYIAGTTYSTSNITTVGAHQPNKAGNLNDFDGYLAKYNGAGQKLWGTYYGGSSPDFCVGVRIFQPDRLYIFGSTLSTSNISTFGTYQNIMSSAMSGFIAAFDGSGTRLWGTYFSGDPSSSSTGLLDICCNSGGDLFITGQTNDSSGLTTTGCYQSSYGGSGGGDLKGDAFIAKFNNAGQRIWSTYLGGAGGDVGKGIGCSPSGDVYVAGWTYSPNNIALNAFQGNYLGGPSGFNGFLAKFNDAGTCIWSTYLGGVGENTVTDVEVSANNYLYISGKGTSLPTTSSSHQPNVSSSASDAYLAKFYDFPTGLSPTKLTNQSIQLYPNPNNGTFLLSGTMPSGEVSLSVTNIAGQPVYSDHFKCADGQLARKVVLSSALAPGLYVVTVVSGNYSAVRRFVKE